MINSRHESSLCNRCCCCAGIVVVSLSGKYGVRLVQRNGGASRVGPSGCEFRSTRSFCFLGLLVFWGFFIEPNLLVVREQTIEIENWPQQLDGLRVAVISDIHVGASFITDEKLRTIVERTNQRQPELIVILGDYMTEDAHPAGSLWRNSERLQRAAWYVLSAW